MKLLCDTFPARLLAALALYGAMTALWMRSSAPLPAVPPASTAAAHHARFN